jgi:hypothetical protein
MAKVSRRAPFALDVRQDYETVWMERDSLDSNWRGTCSNGHDVTYRTAVYVVDASHWCDGTEGWMLHDPHEAADEWHHECPTCGVVVKVGIIPAGSPIYLPGMKHANVSGVQSSGVEIEAWLTEELTEQATAVLMSDDAAAQQAFLDSLPEAQIVSRKFSR